MRRTFSWAIRTTAFLVFLAFLWTQAAGAAVTRVKEAPTPRSLIFAFPGYASRETIVRKFKPFVDHLEKKLNRKIFMKVFSNYFEVLEQLEKDSVDLAQLTPVLYSSVMDSQNLEFLGIQVIAGDYFYQSHIVTRADSQIKSLDDLRDKTIGFTNIFSGSGFIIPMLALKDKGLITAQGRQLFKTRMLENHDKLLHNLLKGRVDAAATYNDMINDRKDSLKIIYKIPQPIPQDAFVANKSTLDSALLKEIREAFSSFWDRSGGSHIERFHSNNQVYKDFRKIVNHESTMEEAKGEQR